MNTSVARIYHRTLPTVCLLGALLLGTASFGAESSSISSLTAIEAPAAELAEHMTQLQVYTHKLSLSVAAKNTALAQFYLHESIAKLKQMQEIFP